MSAKKQPQPTILLVEDDTALRCIVERVLASHGFTVMAFACGGDALGAGAAELGVFDIDLPDIDGVQVAEQLLRRQRIGTALFFTATIDARVLARATALGSVIDNGDGVQALLAVIRQHFDDRHLDEEPSR